LILDQFVFTDDLLDESQKINRLNSVQSTYETKTKFEGPLECKQTLEE